MFDLKKDIEKALQKYPGLQLDGLADKIIIEGNFTAFEKSSRTAIENYSVKILFPKDYPFRFPFVVETSERIPRELSRHVKPDATLCFGNPQDELALCRNGISLTWFLEEVLNPHLCREYAREKLGHYPTGERSHGNEGIWEGYYELFGTSDKEVVLRELEMILYHSFLGRNSACYCNSGKKHKACHEKLEPEVLKVGRRNAVALFELLKKDYNEKHETSK